MTEGRQYGVSLSPDHQRFDSPAKGLSVAAQIMKGKPLEHVDSEEDEDDADFKPPMKRALIL
jgi:hypothetical protein